MVNKTKESGNYVYSSVSQDPTRDNKKLEEIEPDVGKVPKIGIRHLQVFLYFCLQFVALGFRVCLSVGIVAMTDPKVTSNPDIPTYPQWKNKNVILSAFFWGYVLPQVFAAQVAKKYGAKYFLIATMICQSVLSFLTPFIAAHFGETGMMVSRALQGFCQGFLFPSCTHLLSQWVPPQERSRLGSIVFTAGKAGTVFAILVTGCMATTWYGWPIAFYFFGCIGLIWCILMLMFGSNSPREDNRISKAEKDFIEKSLGFKKEDHHQKTPWLKICKSVPVWALLAAQSGSIFCSLTLLTQIPTYMNYVMNFNMKQNSLWSSMPYLTFWLLGFIFGPISDWIINKGFVSRGTARKIFNSIGLIVPAGALIALGFTKPDQSGQAVLLLNIAVGFNSACFSGFCVNHMDLSPNHAGTIMGLVNAVSQVTGIIAPLMVELLVTNIRDPLEWRYVFFLAAFCDVAVAIIFNIFGSGEVQSWNSSSEKNGEADKEKQ